MTSNSKTTCFTFRKRPFTTQEDASLGSKTNKNRQTRFNLLLLYSFYLQLETLLLNEKRNIYFCFVLFSLIRTFAPKKN